MRKQVINMNSTTIVFKNADKVGISNLEEAIVTVGFSTSAFTKIYPNEKSECFDLATNLPHDNLQMKMLVTYLSELSK